MDLGSLSSLLSQYRPPPPAKARTCTHANGTEKIKAAGRRDRSGGGGGLNNFELSWGRGELSAGLAGSIPRTAKLKPINKRNRAGEMAWWVKCPPDVQA